MKSLFFFKWSYFHALKVHYFVLRNYTCRITAWSSRSRVRSNGGCRREGDIHASKRLYTVIEIYYCMSLHIGITMKSYINKSSIYSFFPTPPKKNLSVAWWSFYKQCLYIIMYSSGECRIEADLSRCLPSLSEVPGIK